MARKGRDIEKTVSLLEKLIDSNKVKITSPEFIKGKNSKIDREVDVTLRNAIGSTNILVMIECRDRISKKTEGVEWLEQIASKRDDINANKAVVVSSIPFSFGAIQTAQAYNIDLRTIEEVNKDDVELWFGAKHIIESINKQHCYSFTIILNLEHQGKLIETPYPVNDYNAKLYRLKKNNYEMSWNSIWLNHSKTFFADIIPDKEKIRKQINLIFKDENTVELLTKDGWIEIQGIYLDLELWIETRKIPLSKIKEYKDNNKNTIAQTAEFDMELFGKRVIFSLNKATDTGQQSVTIRRKEEGK